MISVERISRKYGDFLAVDDVSFNIGRGEIVGLLGHNGAGKSTIMKMLTGFIEPSAGRVLIAGEELANNPSRGQSHIGYLPENCPVYPEMSVVDFLDFTANLRRIGPDQRPDAVRSAIERADLGEKAQAIIGTLSRGYRQRVGVAQALLHNPEILILDEPTNGLDPGQIEHMRGLIKGLGEQATLLISTHILHEVEAVC
ncbi:MAG: ABC transporter ATP-binding protein, partial [Geopsychrobacter sp.]|nr:ABC transporter ATP-binding protein [Geopsychrobacter sp.]